MNKDVILKDLKLLIGKYEQVKKNLQVKKYSEEETKKDFILPLFEILGWNVSDRNEVSAEEHIASSGRVDYGFYINGRVKFYLEAKSLKEDLNREDYARQAIKYSFNKGATWAVLTDFESIKVFNAQAISKYLGDKLYFEIPYDKYTERLDQLLQLSKTSFEKDLIDAEAKKVGKMLQKIPVGELLYKDLRECREILTHDLSLWNGKVDKELLDEGVQKILDRLIFLRVAEDRKIEPPTLIPLIRKWESTDRKTPLYKSMISTFRELDSIYNSNLFSKHSFEGWEDYSDATKKVIDILYGKAGYYEYDFKAMPADVLGGVYENYLGYKLSQSKKGLSVGENAKKRKEQGIYYTPTFIVNYIVRNALKPVLDRCKSVNDLKKIKVLDPACGSGSFLIKALEIIADKYRDFNCRVDEFTKIEIIMENLYGVDLDEQAVEIARLNLLINTLEQRGIMPSLDKNIKNGNSLISGTDKELEKYFGKNFRDKKPFNWREEFPEVFRQGGFDVIISNPPYVSITGIDYDLKKTLEKMYQTAVGRFDLFVLFLEKSVNLLKKNGMFGVIIPNKFLTNDQSFKSREFILNKGKISSILFSQEKVFSDPSVNNIVLIFEKEGINMKCEIYEYRDGQIIKISENSNENFTRDAQKRFSISKANRSDPLLRKIEQNTIKLDEIAEVRDGIVAGRIKDLLFSKKSLNKFYKPLLFGNDINRYSKNFSDNYVNYQKDMMRKYEIERVGKLGIGLRMRHKELYERPKILTRKTADRIIATYDDELYYYEQTLHSTYVTDKNYLSLYILGLLNSSLVKYFYQSIVKQSGTIFPQVRISFLKSLPIRKASMGIQQKISKIVKKMLDLNGRLAKVAQNSNVWNSIKSEIEKTDRKIDEEVYKLYSLTSGEISIVENS